MQEMDKENIKGLIIVSTLIFLIAPVFVFSYVFIHNRRKKRHIEEKALMQLTFDAEITKTQLEVQEQTMQTIGADLHDNIGQLLSITSLTLNSIELDNDKKNRKKIDAAIDLTMRSIKEMRLLGKLLQGDQLVGMGLDEAIKYEINWIEKSGKYKVNYTNDGEMPAASSPDKDLILFRILQEVLNNIIKHAQATVISIKLEYEDSVLRLQVNDNGIGFNHADLQPGQVGMGLRNIQKRAGIIGGEANITSNPDEGTTIEILTPYP